MKKALITAVALAALSLTTATSAQAHSSVYFSVGSGPYYGGYYDDGYYYRYHPYYYYRYHHPYYYYGARYDYNDWYWRHHHWRHHYWYRHRDWDDDDD